MNNYNPIDGEDETIREIPPVKPSFKKGILTAALVAIAGGGLIYNQYFKNDNQITVKSIEGRADFEEGVKRSSKNLDLSLPAEIDQVEPITPPEAYSPPPIASTADKATKAIIIDKSSSSMLSAGSRAQSNSRSTVGAAPPTGKYQDDWLSKQYEKVGTLGSTSASTGFSGGSLLGNSKGTSVATLSASMLSNRDFLLAKGSYIDCVLNTRLDSSVSGMVSCTLTGNIYSDNGNILLLEKGSTVVGEYQSGIAQGQNRLAILWSRIKTPFGVVANISSPASGSLGAAGVGGHLDTHFWQRFGGAMMLSLIDDTAAYIANNGSNDDDTIRFENSSDASQQMAAEVLKNTINIQSTLKKNQGSRVGIFVARDVDFSSVYKLSLSARNN